ncbi:MAG: hypothetical protein ABR581_03560 [Thermoleophilaceae bacterium]
MSRRALVALVAGLCFAGGAAALILVDPKDDRSGVESRLRRLITRPGPEQIAPNGERPRTIRCRRSGDRRWSCRVSYPSGLRLQCLVGERKGEQGPICESPQGRVPPGREPAA